MLVKMTAKSGHWAVIFLCVYPCLGDTVEENAGKFDSFAKIM